MKRVALAIILVFGFASNAWAPAGGAGFGFPTFYLDTDNYYKPYDSSMGVAVGGTSITLNADGTAKFAGTVTVGNLIGGGSGSGDFMADGSVPMTADLNMGAQALTNVGNVDGVDVSAHAASASVHHTATVASDLEVMNLTATGGTVDYLVASDGANGLAWKVDATGGGGANLFETVAGDTGTSAVADITTDTLTLAGGNDISTVGSAAIDTLTFNLDTTATLDTEWDALSKLPINTGTGLSATGDTINWAASFAGVSGSISDAQTPDNITIAAPGITGTIGSGQVSADFFLESEASAHAGSVSVHHAATVDTDTTYNAGAGIALTGTTFSFDGTLDEVGNPATDKTFTMGNNTLTFSYAGPSVGAFVIDADGGFTGDLLHVHQHTGNPSTGTYLFHLENDDVDVVPMMITTVSSKAMSIGGGIVSSSGASSFTTLTLGNALPVGSGGTGAGTLTDGGVLLGSGTGAVTPMAVLADSAMIVGDGTTDPVAESGATLRTSIGVAIGTDVQAYDATLADLATAPLTEAESIGDAALPTAASFNAVTSTTIELGHATDTTLSRASAGDVNIEANIIYRAGGTDVALADGGTGASTAALARAALEAPPPMDSVTIAGAALTLATYPIGKQGVAITVTAIDCITDTGTVEIMLEEGTGTAFDGGVDMIASTITCDSNGAVAGTIQNQPIDAADWMAIRIGTEASSPTMVGVTWTYTVD